MPKVRLTNALRAEYQTLFDTCQVRPSEAESVEKCVQSLLDNKSRYTEIAEECSMPWQVVAVIHNMECSQRFDTHLHNGDPLNQRTIHVPKGRPIKGNPPFLWKDSAVDALVFDGLAEWDDWSIPGMLYRLEGFNGWGYRLYHPEVKSPYLWSGSTHYTSGKYIADGTWSDTAVSRQNGAATILRRIAEKNELDADSHIPDESLAAAMSKNVALYAYAPRKISTAGIELQRFLNGFPGVFLKEDGRLGPKTSAAFYTIFGKYLQGDPRNEQASAIA